MLHLEASNKYLRSRRNIRDDHTGSGAGSQGKTHLIASEKGDVSTTRSGIYSHLTTRQHKMTAEIVTAIIWNPTETASASCTSVLA